MTLPLPELPAGFEVSADQIRDAAAGAAREILDPTNVDTDLDPDFWIEVFETVRLKLLKEDKPTRRRTAFRSRK